MPTSGSAEDTSAVALQKVRQALAFIVVYELDVRARQSVQSMQGWAARARRQADKALRMLNSGSVGESWKDIEHAPKDGRPFWVFNGEQGVMRWIEGDEYGLWI